MSEPKVQGAGLDLIDELYYQTCLLIKGHLQSNPY